MYRIYGKVVKEYWFGQAHHTPQKVFRALTRGGSQVSRLADAYCYATKEEAQQRIDRAIKNLTKNGHADCVLFEIRKV